MITGDKFKRPMRDLRIAVTDRCNLRCSYCMPKEVFGRDYAFLDRSELLTFEEITRIAKIFVSLGIDKVRITGGEPLLRRGLPDLVAMLSNVGGIEDLTLTTNGVLLKEHAQDLKDAGLQRVTVSLDSLDDEVFQAMNDSGVSVAAVLEGIEAAADAGLNPIKINAVVQKGVNDHTIVALARRFRGTGHIVRFIEYMDVGMTNRWRLEDVISVKQIINMIGSEFPIDPADANYKGEVARRWRYRDGRGEIGVIASVTDPFCANCTRIRLAPEGQLYTCLFAATGYDLCGLVRSGTSDQQIARFICDIWTIRDDRYSELRASQTLVQPRVEMSYIGG